MSEENTTIIPHVSKHAIWYGQTYTNKFTYNILNLKYKKFPQWLPRDAPLNIISKMYFLHNNNEYKWIKFSSGKTFNLIQRGIYFDLYYKSPPTDNFIVFSLYVNNTLIARISTIVNKFYNTNKTNDNKDIPYTTEDQPFVPIQLFECLEKSHININSFDNVYIKSTIDVELCCKYINYNNINPTHNQFNMIENIHLFDKLSKSILNESYLCNGIYIAVDNFDKIINVEIQIGNYKWDTFSSKIIFIQSNLVLLHFFPDNEDDIIKDGYVFGVNLYRKYINIMIETKYNSSDIVVGFINYHVMKFGNNTIKDTTF